MSVLAPPGGGAPAGLFDTLAAQTFRVSNLSSATTPAPTRRCKQRESWRRGFTPCSCSRRPRIQVRRRRGTGPSRTRGDLAFLDADDRWHEDKLARQAELFAAQPDATIAGCQGEVVDAGGGFLEMIIPEDVFRHPDPARVLFWDSYLQTSSVAIRRSALAARPFDESLRIAEDRDLWIRTAMEGQLTLIEGHVPLLPRSRAQMTRSATVRYRDMIKDDRTQRDEVRPA